jgi:hypothetical protein
MEIIIAVLTTIVVQLQKPTLAFLIGGMVLAAMGSRFQVAESVYHFIVAILLLKVGIGAGIAIKSATLAQLAVPAILALLVGITIIFLGRWTLAVWPGVNQTDGIATAGLFGAVSASTLAAGMAMLDTETIPYEAFIGALYPFMDIAALVTAIVIARILLKRAGGEDTQPGLLKTILIDTLRSPAVGALLIGLAIGIFGNPVSVYDSFYEPLFRGLLSILMLIMGMEAWQRLSELKGVAHAYLAYGIAAPFVHGAIGFGAGMIANTLTGFSAGGVVLLAVMAASSSDISGPPTLRGALPEANPSAYIGTSTGLGTPIAILSIPIWIALAGALIGF